MYILLPEFFVIPVYCVNKGKLATNVQENLNNPKNNIMNRNKAQKKQNLLIGMSFPDPRGRYVMDMKAMQTYASDKGVRTELVVDETDPIKQEKQVDDLISKGINILIIAPVDSFTSKTIAEKAHKAGIKVIAYDRMINDTDVDLYVSFDSTRIGELQARYLIETSPKGNYIVLSGDHRDSNSKLLKDGQMEYLRPLVFNRDIKIVTDKEVINWAPKAAYKIVKDSLKENKNNINAILAPNDGTAGGAIDALRTQGLEGKIPVTGQDAELDAVRRVVKGLQLMTIFKDTREMGKAAVEAAIKLGQGQPLDVNGTVNNGKSNIPSILFTPVVVTADNVNEILIYSGYFSKEEVYGR